MIVKITRGSRSGDLAAYLHGPGRANEHAYDGQAGGAVIGGNLGREGDRDGASWAADLRDAARERPEIKNPIWHASLRSAPGDRTLTDAEWADAGSKFAEKMGFADRPWVMVRHADDHVHVAASRVSETGEVWHAKQDYRQAQSAAKDIERDYGLSQAPRRREGRPKQTRGQEIARHRADAARPAEARQTEQRQTEPPSERVRAVRARSQGRSAERPDRKEATVSQKRPPERGQRDQGSQEERRTAAERVRAAREQAQRGRDEQERGR